MKVHIVVNTDKRVSFEVTECDLALINALRRTVLADVPNVALLHEPYASDGSQFEFRQNTCALHDHIMAHRLSMVPLHLSRGEAQSYIPGSIKVRLAAENRGQEPMDVTTEHCTITLHDRPHPDTARLYPADPDTGDRPLLTVLKPGEKIDMLGTAVSGTAAKHAAFAVVSLCTFSPILDPELVSAGQEAAEKADNPKRAANRFQHIDRKRCWKAGADGNPTAFRFTVESECGMTAEDIIRSAIDVLERRVTACSCKNPDIEDDKLVTYEFKGEGDTLGNLLQSSAVDLLCGDDGPLLFAGYFKPHPLQDRVLLRCYLATGTPAEALQAIKDAAMQRLMEFKGSLLEAFSGVAS